MRTVIIGQIVAAYLEDADCPEFGDCLAEHLPHVSDAYLRNPLALSRHLMAQGFGEPLPASGFGRDVETIMRAIVAGPCRHFAEFSKRQLAFDLRRDFERDDVPAGLTMAMPVQQQQADASTAPVLPAIGHDDGDYALPSAMPGLISYRLRGRYGFIAISALSAAEAMRQAARSTPAPDRAALEVWCDAAGSFIAAPPDHSEGANVSRDEFWRRYAAEAAGMYASGKLPPPLRLSGRATAGPRELAWHLTADMRERIEANPASVDVNGPAMKATLRGFGIRGKARRDVLAFIGGLV